MSNRRKRERALPRRRDVCPEDEADPRLFFGDVGGSRRRSWKTLQLCKQVERAAALALAESGGVSLDGAVVASVDPAPDAGRLRVTVVLARAGAASVDEAVVELRARVAAFRDAVARSIHRKRVPEIVFDVRREAEMEVEVERG